MLAQLNFIPVLFLIHSLSTHQAKEYNYFSLSFMQPQYNNWICSGFGSVLLSVCAAPQIMRGPAIYPHRKTGWGYISLLITPARFSWFGLFVIGSGIMHIIKCDLINSLSFSEFLNCSAFIFLILSHGLQAAHARGVFFPRSIRAHLLYFIMFAIVFILICIVCLLL